MSLAILTPHARRWLVAPALLCCALGAGSSATAAIFCVSTGDQLAQALNGPNANGNFASFNGQDDSVRLRPGVYTTLAGAVGGPSWVYDVARDGRALSISGGWNSDCSSQTIDPTLTVLDGRNASQVLAIDDVRFGWGNPVSGSISVANLTLRNGRTFQPININGAERQEAALIIDVDDALTGVQVTVENVVISGHSADPAARGSIAVGIFMGGGNSVRFRNNVIHGNNLGAATSTGIARISAGNGAFSVVSNNSIFGNIASNIVGLDGEGVMTLKNNVIIDNATANASSFSQFTTSNASGMTITHNHLGSFNFNATAPAQFEDNTSGAPLWSGTGPFRIPDVGSPLRDSGTNAVVGGLGSLDARGLTRVVNSVVDRGAVESQPPANTGPIITALTPLSNSTTVLPPSSDPFQTTRVFFFTQSGNGSGQTTVNCEVVAGNGVVTIRPTQTVSNGGQALPVDVAMDNPVAGAGDVQVTLECEAFRENAGVSTLTYFFVTRDPLLFRNGFE